MTSAFDLRAPLRLLRTRRDLRLLLGAGLVSLTGDWILGVGLAYAVYDLTGSTLASAATLLAAFLPQLAIGPVAGVFADRWDRKRTMVVANLVMGLGLAPLLWVTDPGAVWLVYAVLVVQSVAEVFFAPAEQALLPRLVEDAELVTANALNGQVAQLARLVGSALGGVTAAVGGIPAVAVLDGLTFLLAALLVASVRTSGRVSAPDVEPAERVLRERLRSFGRDLHDGLRAARREPAVVTIIAFTAITCAGEGVMGTLFAPFVRDVLHGGGQVYGVITAVQAVGGIVGGLVAAGIGHRWSPTLLFGAGAGLFGLVDLAIFVYPLAYDAVWPAVVGMMLVGVPGAVTMAGYMTLFQRHTVDAERGRVYSLVGLARALAVVVGTTTAGFLGETVGIVPILALQGVGYVVAGAMVLVSLRGYVHEQPSAVVV
ncbi:MFS transporter [Nocardioides mesophilus]|uniref:Multidrug efflux pump Tap n=1 Tax=Nocardioides mesophilus TaxID=433659 RepID=A0A7G9RBY3_9ACTN|nr:MFS transporter [Nocardioides mesophilus]QNN53108.1 MFS transporter [Nocardioides mesophilus]